MKRFNTTAVCIPSKHYMVDLTERVAAVRAMVEEGDYFCINRARQYGKTTLLNEVRKALSDEYEVCSLDFQGIGSASYQTEELFCQSLVRKILEYSKYGRCILSDMIRQDLQRATEEKLNLVELFGIFRSWCGESERPVILMIDEVDVASNYQVFLDFLAGLRESYINRESKGWPTFQSVILAGVTDIKHLRSKIRDEDQHKVNSPWNIAADFRAAMSFDRKDVSDMLKEYEEDHHTGMNPEEIAGYLIEYTSGYPYLVSRLCQIMDERLVPDVFPDLSKVWTRYGVSEAVKRLVTESNNSLFDSLTGKLTNYPQLKENLRIILFEGRDMSFNPDQDDQVLMREYGFIKVKDGRVVIANRIFEVRLYNLFLTEEEMKSSVFAQTGYEEKNIFIKNGRLDMPLILKHFIEAYTEVFGPLAEKFKEKDGREYFLLYLKPIINGTGNYYIEAQTRNQTRTDVVVDYRGEQYVIELKIWRGKVYHENGEEQIREYLDYFGLDTGYMLSFNFNKKKEQGVRRVKIGEKVLYEATL